MNEVPQKSVFVLILTAQRLDIKKYAIPVYNMSLICETLKTVCQDDFASVIFLFNFHIIG